MLALFLGVTHSLIANFISELPCGAGAGARVRRYLDVLLTTTTPYDLTFEKVVINYWPAARAGLSRKMVCSCGSGKTNCYLIARVLDA